MEQKTEASQAVDLPLPPMPLPVVKHAVIGDLFDCFAMQQYAMRYADLVVAALKAQPAPTDPVAWMCPNDPDSASAFIWARKGVDYSNMSCDSCGGKHVPVYRQPAPTEAAQGNTSNNSSSSQISGNSGELQPSGNTGELAQGWDVDDLISDMDINEEVAGMRAELQASSTIIPSILAAQGEDSARLDALHDQMVDTIYMDDGRVIDVGGKHLNDLRKAIDEFLARASAETGGVKP